MDVAVVGAGRVGTALALLLTRAGHAITAVSGRDATHRRAATYLSGVPVLPAADAAVLGDLVLIAVPDDVLASTVVGLAGVNAFRRGAWVSHVSGAAGLEVLTPVASAGAHRLAIHPLQTVPDVEAGISRIPGSSMAVTADDEEGFALGERLATDVGASPLRIADELRPLYHAAAVFASNYLVVAAGLAERLFREAGVPDPVAAFLPLSRAALDNVERLGTADALTGPAVRGDSGTVERNLAALGAVAPEGVAAYVELCRSALDLAARGDRSDAAGRLAVEEVLDRWT